MTAGVATDFTPLVERIYEVLCEGEGVYRTLAEGDRFVAKMLPGESDAVLAKKARVQKLVLVAVDEMLDSVNTQEFSDRAEYAIKVRVDLAYSSPNPIERARLIDLMTHAKNDAHKVRQALGWPANMTATKDARATGVRSGLAFVRAGGDRLSDQSRLYTTTLSLTASVWLAMITT